MADDDDVRALVDVAARMDAAFAGGMKTQLQWLEDAAVALDAIDANDSDDTNDANDDSDDSDDSERPSTSFKAALGAILTYAQGKQDPATLPELETVVRTLLTRGTV